MGAYDGMTCKAIPHAGGKNGCGFYCPNNPHFLSDTCGQTTIRVEAKKESSDFECKGRSSCTYDGMTCKAIPYGGNNGCGFYCPNNPHFLSDTCGQATVSVVEEKESSDFVC